jgi:undecaprenyl-diphosphatase
LAKQTQSKPTRWLRQAETTTWRFNPNELLMLVALLIVVLGTWGFIELAGRVTAGSTQNFDQSAVEWFRSAVLNHVALPPDVIDQTFEDISALGGPTVLLLMTTALLGFLLWDRRYNAMLLMIMATAGAAVLTWLLKEAIGRNRPDVEHLTVASLSSFPSGHSMLSAVIYPTLGTLLARVVPRKRLKIYFMLVALTLSGLIGVSRIYLRVHYPTDVLAGWAAGLAWAAFCWSVAKYLQRRGALEGGEDETGVETTD